MADGHDNESFEAEAAGLAEETGPMPASSKPQGEAAPRPFIKRGIADLAAEELAQQPRALSHDAVEESTQPGIRIPIASPAPLVSQPGGTVPSKPPGAPSRTGLDTAPVSLADVSRSGALAAPAPPTVGVEIAAVAAARSAETSTPELRRRLLPVLVTGVLACAAMVWAIVTQWVPPHMAIVLMSVGMLVPTVGIALFMSSGARGGTLRRVWPALFVSACGIALAGAWSLQEVRAAAVPYAPDEVRSMKKMFADPSLSLAAAGCHRFATHYEEASWSSELFDVLSARPELATRCLEGLPEVARHRMGGSLVDRWSRELGAEGDGLKEARACVIANGIRALPVPVKEFSGRLLECTITAPSSVAQKCCGRALAASVEGPEQWAERLAGAVEFTQGERVRAGVFAMALHRQGLTPEQIEFVDSVKFGGVEGQRAALDLACAEVGTKGSNVLKHLRATLDENCEVKLTKLPAGPETWSRICSETQKQVRAGVGLSPISTLCQLAKESESSTVPGAIGAARQLIQGALTSP